MQFRTSKRSCILTSQHLLVPSIYGYKDILGQIMSLKCTIQLVVDDQLDKYLDLEDVYFRKI